MHITDRDGNRLMVGLTVLYGNRPTHQKPGTVIALYPTHAVVKSSTSGYHLRVVPSKLVRKAA